jgi:uncharacterized protein
VVSAVPVETVLARLSPEDRRVIETLRDELKAMLGLRLKDLRLFGSKARGDDHDESDIDVLVLVEGRDRELFQEIFERGFAISTWLSLSIQAFDDYHAPSSRVTGFYKELRKDSVKLL